MRLPRFRGAPYIVWAWSRWKVEIPECIAAAEDEYGAVEYEGPE